jgi:hypothetical protein
VSTVPLEQLVYEVELGRLALKDRLAQLAALVV